MNKKNIAYFGHHKSGSTWIQTLVQQVCYQLGLKLKIASTPKLFNFDLKDCIAQESFDFLCYTNADLDYVKPIVQDVKGFHVIRDPRDIIISAYFSHLHSHSTNQWPELIDYREKLSQLSLDDGLLYVMEYLSNKKVNGVEINVFGSMSNWNYHNPDILEVKFEEFIINPYGKFLDILKFLDLLDDSPYISVKSLSKYVVEETINRGFKKINSSSSTLVRSNNKIYPWQALNIIYEHDFARYAKGRSPGKENIKSHNRKGIAGDWKNYFKTEHKESFKDKYGYLLIDLGYEDNNDW